MPGANAGQALLDTIELVSTLMVSSWLVTPLIICKNYTDLSFYIALSPSLLFITLYSVKIIQRINDLWRARQLANYSSILLFFAAALLSAGGIAFALFLQLLSMGTVSLKITMVLALVLLMIISAMNGQMFNAAGVLLWIGFTHLIIYTFPLVETTAALFTTILWLPSLRCLVSLDIYA